ncbi:MAG TPA: cyclodeaminase/cyclohydrolase family protein [Acidobacteriaceae bacterium]|jgi:formiminotetrahydrofolate cyclodeaminase
MEPTPTDLAAMSLRTLFAEAASAETAAAGGCVSAVSGYLGVSVLLKCVRISARKRPQETSYAESEERLLKFADQLLACAQADADSFAGYKSAIGLPKSTPEEALDRKQEIRHAVATMTTAALDILDAGNRILEFAHRMRDSLTAPVLADALGGVELISAMNATAQWNAKANLGALSGEESLQHRFAEARTRHDALLAECRSPGSRK